MSLEPFRLVIPPGPLTPAYIQTAAQTALADSSQRKPPLKPIRWAIVAETAEGWVVEGVCALREPISTNETEPGAVG